MSGRDGSGDPALGASSDAEERLARALDLPTPTGNGRLELMSQAPWEGLAVAVDPRMGTVAIARRDDVLLTSITDLGTARSVAVAGAWSLALTDERLVCVAGLTGLHLIDTTSGQVTHALRSPGPLSLALSPGGSRLAVVGGVAHPRATVGVVDLGRRTLDWTLAIPDASAAAWCGPEVLAVAGRGVDLLAWDGRRLPRLGTRRLDAACSWGECLIVSGRDSVAEIWHVDGTSLVGTIPCPPGVGRRSLHSEGGLLASGSLAAGGATALIGLPEGRVARVLAGVRAVDMAGERLVGTGPAGTFAWRWVPES